IPKATEDINLALLERFRERDLSTDSRVKIAIAGLTNQEIFQLQKIADFSPTVVWGRPNTSSVDFFDMASIPRLLDKQLIRVMGQFEEGHPAYSTTPLGQVVAQLVKNHLTRFKADSPPAPATGEQDKTERDPH